MSTRTIVRVAVGLASLIGVVGASAGAGAGAVQSDAAALRKATARYHSVQATLASGRVDLNLCVDHMGQHYANPITFSDGRLDPTDPEAMVYADDGRGHLRLVAVEWVSTTPGSVGTESLHFNPSVGLYVLHAWVWQTNPDGLHADMNPDVGTCP